MLRVFIIQDKKLLIYIMIIQELDIKLLNDIRQIVYSWYQSKQITKKVYSNN